MRAKLYVALTFFVMAIIILAFIYAMNGSWISMVLSLVLIVIWQIALWAVIDSDSKVEVVIKK